MCVLSCFLALVVDVVVFVFSPFQCAKVFSLCRSHHCAVILKGFVAIFGHVWWMLQCSHRMIGHHLNNIILNVINACWCWLPCAFGEDHETCTEQEHMDYPGFNVLCWIIETIGISRCRLLQQGKIWANIFWLSWNVFWAELEFDSLACSLESFTPQMHRE